MTIAATPRTGHQYTITHGDYVAVITELGAALRKLTYQGKNVIATFGANEVAPASSGQLLIPYPNRIEDGVYTFEGKTYELPIDEHERRNAIHGYGYRAYWTLENLDESTVTLSWRVPNMAGYPFDVVVAVTYTLTDNGLSLTVAARNNGETNAPWALAIHPWLANGFDGYGDEIDGQNAQCSLMVPADTHVTVDDRLLPTGTEPVDGTKYDFREPMKLDQ
ncbi:aldose epimerase, partial [Bifidobacterium sp. UBA4282]